MTIGDNRTNLLALAKRLWRDGQEPGVQVKDLERENAQLKKLVANLVLDKAILEEALSKK